MTQISKVALLFSEMAGLDAQEALAYLPLLRLTAGQVERRLRRDDLTADEEERLAYLCAAKAYQKYLLAQGVSQVRVGEVSVQRENYASARAFADSVEASCADLLRDEGFLFCLDDKAQQEQAGV